MPETDVAYAGELC